MPRQSRRGSMAVMVAVVGGWAEVALVAMREAGRGVGMGEESMEGGVSAEATAVAMEEAGMGAARGAAVRGEAMEAAMAAAEMEQGMQSLRQSVQPPTLRWCSVQWRDRPPMCWREMRQHRRSRRR